MGKERNKANIGNWKVLTVYFSHSGNTRKCANRIHERLGGDILEVIPVEAYPLDYDRVVAQAKRELKADYRPALKTGIENIDAYDVICVGSPNWWNTVAPPVMTFLSGHELSGKAILPFVTHAGTGLGASVRDIARLCPSSTVLEGLAVWGRDAQDAQHQVFEWLDKLGM